MAWMVVSSLNKATQERALCTHMQLLQSCLYVSNQTSWGVLICLVSLYSCFCPIEKSVFWPRPGEQLDFTLPWKQNWPLSDSPPQQPITCMACICMLLPLTFHLEILGKRRLSGFPASHIFFFHFLLALIAHLH